MLTVWDNRCVNWSYFGNHFILNMSIKSSCIYCLNLHICCMLNIAQWGWKRKRNNNLSSSSVVSMNILNYRKRLLEYSSFCSSVIKLKKTLKISCTDWESSELLVCTQKSISSYCYDIVMQRLEQVLLKTLFLWHLSTFLYFPLLYPFLHIDSSASDIRRIDLLKHTTIWKFIMLSSFLLIFEIESI